MLWPSFVVAAGTPAPAAVPVVSKISGAVSVRGSDGISNDVISSRIIHSGDTLVTGLDSLALVNLADVGSVRIGPATTARASVSAGNLSVALSSGLACAEALSRGVSIDAGQLVVSAADETAIFSLDRSQNTTMLAVYQGNVRATTGSGSSARVLTFRAGEAAVAGTGAVPQQVAIASVQSSFDPLQCPDPDIIASVVPTPAPSGAPSGGHGGGGAGGILAALLGLGAIVAAAGGHGGGGGGNAPTTPPTTPPTPPPGTLNLSTNSLSFLVNGSAQNFTASESNYTGPIAAASNNTNVVSVSPASGNGPGPVQFAVTPVGAGSTTITVTDNHSGTQTVNVTVSPPGSILVSPNTLGFLSGAVPQTFNASEANYTGALTASSKDTNVATVSGSGNGPGPVTFTVTPVHSGNTNIMVHGGASPATVGVTVVGPLQTDVGTLTFLGTTASQTFSATDPNYTGALSASSDNTAVATVSPSSQNGPGPATFTVTPVSQGNANITVSDTFGGSTKVSVSVSSGGLAVNPTKLTFPDGSGAQTFSASEANYTNNIFASSTDTTVATVTPASGLGPGPITFTVTPVGPGTAQIVVTDNHGGNRLVNIRVFGPLQVSTPSVSLTGAGSTQQFNASESFYTGLISATSLNSSIATVSPSSGNGPGPVTFTVTAAGPGSTTIDVTDDHGDTQPVGVTVTETPLINPNTFSFTDVGPVNAQSATLSETGYSGAWTLVGNTCGGVADISAPSSDGPSATINVTALQTTSGGSCHFAFQDSFGSASAAANVTVGPFGTVNLSTSSMSFSDVGSGAAQMFTASESGYSGPLTPNDSNCAGVASVSPPSGPSGTTFTVTPQAAGAPCNIVVGDDHTQSAPLSVTVGPFGTITPSPTSFTFTDVGAGSAAPLTVSESGYSGNFSIDASACAGVATVSPTSSSGNFTVTPVGPAGPCNLNISDDHGSPTVQVSVTVAIGPLVPNPSTINSKVGGSSTTMTVSDGSYSGNLTLTTTCPGGVATVSPTIGTTSTPFTVTPVGVGNCKIVVADDTGVDNATVDVFVTAGSLTVSPNTLTFPANSAGTTAQFTASDSACLFGDQFTATPDGTVAASASPVGSPVCFAGVPVTFTVTAGANGQGTVTVTDPEGGSAVVSVGVGVSPLVKKHHKVELHKPAPGTGKAPEPHQGGGALGGSPAPPASPVPGSTASAPLQASVTNLLLLENGPSQPVTITEMGYARRFAVASSNPNVAALSVATGNGPIVTLLISPKAAGAASIRILDDHGGVRIVQVIVRSALQRQPGAHVPR